MKNLIARFVAEEEGQDLIEYALLVAFIALVCVAGITAGGQGVSSVWVTVSSALGAASAAI